MDLSTSFRGSSWRSLSRRALHCTWLAVLVSVAVQAQVTPTERPPAPGPAVTFEDAAVVVTGLTPGGDVQLFSVAREAAGYLARVVRRDQRILADATGTARYELDGTVPLYSVWAAIDVSSGALGLGSPPGFVAQEIGFPSDGVQRGNGGRWNRLRSQMGGAYVVFLRPGNGPDAGVWGVSSYDGSGADADGAQDGRIDTALDLLFPLGGSPEPPSELAAGDVLVVIDPSSLSYFATRFGA